MEIQKSDIREVHILVVDDESSIRELLQEYLSLEGYKVDSAKDGNDAFEYLRKNYYDIVLTDLEMPGMNGIELLKKANTQGLNHKFIILTGFGTVETAIMALKLGAVDYILKPFKLEELGLIIKKKTTVSEALPSKPTPIICNKKKIKKGLRNPPVKKTANDVMAASMSAMNTPMTCLILIILKK